MIIWTVAREYAGIAEAGGVKNVSCSLCEALVKAGHHVTLFIPLYGCTDLSAVAKFDCSWHRPVTVKVNGTENLLYFSHGEKNGVEIVFVGNRMFSEKKAVYTYTKEDEASNPRHKRGQGHEDSLCLNTLFEKAVVAYGETCFALEKPDIIHCHDAATAMIPVFIEAVKEDDLKLRAFYWHTKCIVTIHNAGNGYHHEFPSVAEAASCTALPRSMLTLGLNDGHVEPFLLASHYSSLTTVSPQYAEEILSEDENTGGLAKHFRADGTSIIGITNGIDYERYDPRNQELSLLPYTFNPLENDLQGKYKCRSLFLSKYASLSSLELHINKTVEQHGYLEKNLGGNTVYVVYHGRVVNQKGISVLEGAARIILEKQLPVNFIFIGQGEPELEEKLVKLSVDYVGKVVFFRGYDKAFSRLCIAAADFAVMPSNFEPCGIEDFIAQIYGTLPVAHATGGLRKIVDEETGFLYDENTPENLALMLFSLVKIISLAGQNVFAKMIRFAASYIKENYSWPKVTEAYLELYRSVKNET